MTTLKVDGVKETIAELRRIDPELRKTFNANVRAIVKPLVDQAKQRYKAIQYPSGTARRWEQRGREIFPLDPSRAVRGVGVKTSTSKRNASTIVVVQSNAGASVFEFADSGNLGASFRSKNGGTPRVMWPTADDKLPQVTENMAALVDETAADISRRLQ